MDLFKTFTRGQENAQDQLNDNFVALEGAVIVESGSNANGSWTKFADGMMICKRTITAGGATTARGQLFSTPSYEWTFPHKFAYTPHINASATTGASGSWGASGDTGVGLEKGSWRILNALNNSSGTPVELIAIGRWK